MRLAEISAPAYARDVLPETATLWAGRRDFETYVGQTLELARSGYGRRHYRTVGLYDGKTLLASFKRYERTMHDGPRRLRAIGIGAVFTPPERRGRGYASVMLASALDAARADGCDAAYLFSDVRPQFYGDLGFRELPSRRLVLRADALPGSRLDLARLEERDWNGVRRCYDLCERSRSAGFLRTPLVWDWIRKRMTHGSEHAAGQQTNLVVRHGRGVGAYVLGVRAPERDTFDLDEFGFVGPEGAAEIPALLRCAAGDLRRIAGWLPPAGARELLPRGSVTKRTAAIFMIAPLTAAGANLVRTLAAQTAGDGCWPTDHV